MMIPLSDFAAHPMGDMSVQSMIKLAVRLSIRSLTTGSSLFSRIVLAKGELLLA